MCSHVCVCVFSFVLSFYCTYLSVFSLLLRCTSVNKGLYIKHPVPDRVKPPFAIFDIRAL